LLIFTGHFVAQVLLYESVHTITVLRNDLRSRRLARMFILTLVQFRFVGQGQRSKFKVKEEKEEVEARTFV